MQVNWPKSIAWVRVDEGGNNDNKSDHGGRTSRGIIQREFDACCALYHWVPGDVWKATDQQIDTIYNKEYWQPHCDGLPSGADYLFFDMNVNAGLHEAIILLQRAVGVKDDGRIGPVTRLACQRADLSRLIADYSQEKRAFYRRIATHKGQAQFLKGWLNRADHVEQRAKTLIVPPTESKANV